MNCAPHFVLKNHCILWGVFSRVLPIVAYFEGLPMKIAEKNCLGILFKDQLNNNEVKLRFKIIK